MVYEYKCPRCRKTTSVFSSVADRKDRVKCTCGKMAKRVYSQSAVLVDGDPTWLESAKANLPKDAERIETRGEWKSYLHNKGLICVG